MGPQPIGTGRSASRHVALAEAAGLVIVDFRQETLRVTFHDVGAFVYFLRKVPWTVPGFSVDVYDALETSRVGTLPIFLVPYLRSLAVASTKRAHRISTCSRRLSRLNDGSGMANPSHNVQLKQALRVSPTAGYARTFWPT